MSAGKEQRAQIDNETYKGLLLINGGAAVALLAQIPTILNLASRYQPLAFAMFASIVMLSVGLVFAVVHNHLRRRCSLKYERHRWRPPKGVILGFTLPSPTVCFFSWTFMCLSLGAFVVAVTIVAIVGVSVL